MAEGKGIFCSNGLSIIFRALGLSIAAGRFESKEQKNNGIV